METVYRPTRTKNGKKKVSRLYRGRFKVFGRGKLQDVALKTSDRQVATQMLRKIVSDLEREAAGILTPKALREAATLPLAVHLEEYIADLDTRGRDWEYIRHVEARIKIISNDCGWKRLGDISADSFQAWRSKKAASPKTLNEYLNAAIAFLNWLIIQERISVNPLAKVGKVEGRGRETFQRRALNVQECQRLLQVSGSHQLFYLIALTTGLRRGEINGLRWHDVEVNGQNHFLRVRASTTKNHQSATIALRPELVELLKVSKLNTQDHSELVFPKGVPRNRDLRKDFEKAGIQLLDSSGAKVDFHALRHTFCTMLQQGGVSARVAMEAMRHSDMRLTAKVYTDARSLPTREALMGLPALIEDSLPDSLAASFSPDTDCRDVSQTGEINSHLTERNLLQGKELCAPRHGMSQPVAKVAMVEAGGIEPPSEYESPKLLRACFVFESRHDDCQRTGHRHRQHPH